MRRSKQEPRLTASVLQKIRCINRPRSFGRWTTTRRGEKNTAMMEEEEEKDGGKKCIEFPATIHLISPYRHSSTTTTLLLLFWILLLAGRYSKSSRINRQ